MTAREWLRSPEAIEVAARAIADRHGTCDEQAWQTMSADFREHFTQVAVAALTALLDRMPYSEEIS